MRLAGQAKRGYFPASPNAIAALVRHLALRPPNAEKANETVQVIDPCAGEWAEVSGIPYRTLKDRIRHGWTIERAITDPVKVTVTNG
jgi:hypothetical protein